MPFYRFALHGSKRYADPEGIELLDDAAARREAILILSDMGRGGGLDVGGHDWTIEVTEGERLVCKVRWPS